MNISIVMSTYNRSSVLSVALDSLAVQKTNGLLYEIVIVDNNSTDNTRQVVEAYTQHDAHFRYVFEKKQGLAHGRNAGIAAAQSDLIAFCDDDVIVAPDWIQKLHEALLRFHEADFIGGKVLPLWANAPPKWLHAKLSPLALQDFGDKPEIISLTNQRCLIGACLAMRRRAFERGGYFDPATQRVGNSIGSTEDYDWEMKVLKNGGIGVYVPEVICYAEVPADRMKKSYHRRWHLGHGKFNAIARRPHLEGGSFQVLGVPAFVYRQFGEAISRYLRSLLRGKAAEIFERENDVFFFLGAIRHRWKQALTGHHTMRAALPNDRPEPSADAP